MFDIGFAELLIIAVISLIVIGPERLPETVRTLSAWISRFRRSFNEIKREVQLELHNDAVLRDLQQTSAQMQSQLKELEDLGRTAPVEGAETPQPGRAQAGSAEHPAETPSTAADAEASRQP